MSKMSKEKLIEQQVEATLNYLDKFESVEASPGFYTRLLQKIQHPGRQKIFSQKQLFSFVVLKPILLILIILFNLITALLILPGRDQAQDNRQKYLKSLISEYNLNQSRSYFDAGN